MMFCRSLKAEKERYQQEMEFQLKIMEMENQRRLQEREHEIRVFSLMMGSGSNMQNLQAAHQAMQYRPQPPENFSGFSHRPTYISHSTPLNVSDSSSETSSSTNIEDGLHYYSL